MDKHLKSNWFLYILLIFIISRIILYYQFHVANIIILHGKQDFTTVMCKWDCKWYLTIINDGYDATVRTTPKIWKGLANWAFFPFYPILVSLLKFITHLNVVLIGIILNQVFIFISAILFYKILRLQFDDLNSRFGATLLIFMPFSVYFNSLYTEALFLCLSLAGFYFIKQQKYMYASILGGFLSATRPVGIMFIIPLAISLLRNKVSKIRSIWYIMLAMSGLLLFMVFLYFKSGDFLAFQHIQKGWGRRGWDTTNLGKQIMFMITDYHNSSMFLISFCASIYLLIKRYYEEALFNLSCIMPGVLTGTMMSEARFSGTLFTLYFAVVVLNRNSWSMKILTFLIVFILYLSYFMYWVAHSTFLI